MTVAAGTRLGPYEILSPLGAGGMGEVYRARDARLGREVAVKVLFAGFDGDAERLRRFEQEACAAGALNHPNILVAHDVGGAPYVVSELLEGETLRERLDGSALPPRKALDYARQITRGLAAAKLMAVDIKPGATFEASVPKPLFDTRVLAVTDFRNHYVVTADGQRFLINSLIEETNTAPITVVLNWTADWKR